MFPRLSEEEFHRFIVGVAGPPDVSSFEDLSWLFKVVHKMVHKSLTCRCQYLRLGDGC